MTITIISGKKGATVLAMTAMAPQFAYTGILSRKLQPDSNVLRIRIQHVMKGSHASKGNHASRLAQVRYRHSNLSRLL